MSCFLYGNHRDSPSLTSLNVLGVPGVLNVLNVLGVLNMLDVLNVLHVLIMPMDASLACWAFFSVELRLRSDSSISHRAFHTKGISVGRSVCMYVTLLLFSLLGAIYDHKSGLVFR